MGHFLYEDRSLCVSVCNMELNFLPQRNQEDEVNDDNMKHVKENWQMT